MPMRLWSIVVSQERQPVIAVGRMNAPSGRRTTVSSPAVSSSVGRSSVSAMESLLERRQVGVQAVDLVFVQLPDHHQRAGLALWVAQPCLQLVAIGEVVDAPGEAVAREQL